MLSSFFINSLLYDGSWGERWLKGRVKNHFSVKEITLLAFQFRTQCGYK